jgi:hypothetical protein
MKVAFDCVFLNLKKNNLFNERQGPDMQPMQASNSDPPASASHMLGLQAWASTPSMKFVLTHL